VPELHLIVALTFFGSEENICSAKRLRENLGLSKGSILNYIDRCVDAILSLCDLCFYWPSPEKRLEIKSRIKNKYRFKNCVGIVSEPHLVLACRPEVHGEECYTRMGQYAVSEPLIFDDNKCNRHATLGWPSSIHDIRVWTNSKVAVHPGNY
jgi:hypothetical protein